MNTTLPEDVVSFSSFKERLKGDKYRNFWPRLTEVEWEEVFDYATREIDLEEIERQAYDEAYDQCWDDAQRDAYENGKDDGFSDGRQNAIDQIKGLLETLHA